MSFFDDDPFEEVVRSFFGGSPVKKVQENNFISGEEEDRNIDLVEGDKNIFVIFELPGYGKEDIEVSVKGSNLKVVASKKSPDYIESYLAKRFNDGVVINKVLPKSIKTKKYDHTMPCFYFSFDETRKKRNCPENGTKTPIHTLFMVYISSKTAFLG